MVLTREQQIFFAMAYRYCSSGKLQRWRSARGCTTMASHLARNLKVGLWMETMLFLLLTGSLEIVLKKSVVVLTTPPGISIITVFLSKLAGVKDTSFMKTQRDAELF